MPDSGSNLLRIRLSLKGRPIRSYTFDKPVITVGRSPTADIVLDNAGVSREHLQFEVMANGHYSVTDKSANGTFLNDEKINESAIIYNNDVVRIGKFSLWVSLERDRRHLTAEHRRSMTPSPSAGTVVLTPDEMNHLMAVSRESESDSPQAPVSYPAARPPSATGHAHTNEQGSRAYKLMAIGAVLILAVSLGFGAAWLIIR